MTETMGYTRPNFQRFELGPIVHEAGHRIYDAIDERITCGDLGLERITKDYPITSLQRTGEVRTILDLSWLAVYIADVGEEAVRQEVNDHSPAYKIGERPLMKHAASPTESPTFNKKMSLLLEEGISTGLVMPVQLYKAIRWTEQFGSDPYFKAQLRRDDFSSELINPVEVGSRMVSDGFIKMLHQLAIGPNGSLGSSSSRSLALVDDDIPFVLDTVQNIRQGQPLQQYLYDDSGRVVGFSDDFIERLLDSHRSHNENKRTSTVEGWTGESGGCPVRHDTFVRVGETATSFLQALGNIDGLPTRQGESLIARGARTISLAIAHLDRMKLPDSSLSSS